MKKQKHKKEELTALINLLDDPDKDVFEQVRAKLLSMGETVIPALENVWESSFDATLQNRIENIIHLIQFNRIVNGLKEWMNTEEQNLLTGAMLVARYQFPDLEEEKLKKKIQQIRQDVWLELNDNLTALEQIRIINHIFFEVHNFSGNTQNYHAPQNSYINTVLETKKGSPLSLSILYLIILQELKIPVLGVNLPEHFVLCYKDIHRVMEIQSNRDAEHIAKGILFYINPFSRGAVFGKKQLDIFLKKLNLEPKPEYYQPCSNVEMIKRLIRNLILSYQKLGFVEKTDELQQMLRVME